ncbi:MAG: hypothetical protein RBS07_12100 [Lentimicrobium sp.]|jgi:hypothetical protein|nr:hypothetical protein [Lentimicrobium sp.]
MKIKLSQLAQFLSKAARILKYLQYAYDFKAFIAHFLFFKILDVQIIKIEFMELTSKCISTHYVIASAPTGRLVCMKYKLTGHSK